MKKNVHCVQINIVNHVEFQMEFVQHVQKDIMDQVELIHVLNVHYILIHQQQVYHNVQIVIHHVINIHQQNQNVIRKQENVYNVIKDIIKQEQHV